MRKKGLTEKQIQILQTLNNKGQIKRYASILAYMIKHKNPETGKFEMSLYRLEQKYNAITQRATLGTLKNAAKKFVELDLLTLEKIDGKNIYTFKYTKEGNNNENL